MTGKDHSPKGPQPEVSVIIAAWCAEGFLAHAVRSALSQTGPSVEVIVADDASPDGTLGVARALALADARVRPVALAANGGPSAARNRALSQARGEWIAILDADDRMVPRRLERMLSFARQTGADAILGNLAEVDETGTPLPDGPFIRRPATPTRLTPERFVTANLRRAAPRTWGYLKPLIRRSALDRHALRYDETLRNGEDFHLILDLLLSGGVVWFCPDADYLYTRRTGSVSDRIRLDDLSALMAAGNRSLARIAGRPQLSALMARRQAELADLMTAETVLRAIKARRIGAARAALADRPAALPLILRQAGEGILRRLMRGAR